MTPCRTLAQTPATPLIQIRRGYTADCGALRLTVDLDNEGWIARVRNTAAERDLYSARRCAVTPAKAAAAEFAAYLTGAAAASEDLARRLVWRERW